MLASQRYQLLGPYELPTYNLSHNLFPANGKFPYGPTVRSHSGRMVEIADFPEGTGLAMPLKGWAPVSFLSGHPESETGSLPLNPPLAGQRKHGE